MKKNIQLQGLIKRHPDGFGFLIPDDKEHPDVYIPHHSMTGVMSNDRVLAEVQPERGGERFRGDIIKVITRGVRKVVGHFAALNDKEGVVRDEGKGWGEDLRVPMTDSMGAKNGDIVAAEIVTYPDRKERFAGRVVEIIGDVEDPMNDIRRIIHGNNIPDTFPEDVEKEAAGIKDVPDEKDYKGRRDLRDKNLITIDGATAKDFDDAVLVEPTDRGFRLYVAIADVSHYVRPGTAIDREAYLRGTSVYFPNFVVPMLPEVLSNGLCSLNPKVPRLCVVAEMHFDFTGAMFHSEFYEAVMESKARCTYGKAQEVVDGVDVPEFAHVKDTIMRCADLAKILMAKRFREGSLDLEIPETQLQIDGAGRPIDVIRSERLFAHRLIEELMLAANVAVAKFLGMKDMPSIYRIHESPNELAIQLLEKYMASFGGTAKLGPGKLQKKLTRALEEFAGKPESHVLNVLTLRSMSQAKYARENVGHFGLGFEHYTHFTSPIRRYPDLIVHRLLKSRIIATGEYRALSAEELDEAGTWLSACEQRSVKAERQLTAIKKARFMQQFLGREFEGLITSIAKFGVFVLLREYDIDGLVRIDDLGGGRWEFDEENLVLVAKGSGFSIRVGDSMKIIVAAADISTGQVSFTPVEVVTSRKLQFASQGENRLNEPKSEKDRKGGSGRFGERGSGRGEKTPRTESPRKEERPRSQRAGDRSPARAEDDRGERRNERRGSKKSGRDDLSSRRDSGPSAERPRFDAASKPVPADPRRQKSTAERPTPATAERRTPVAAEKSAAPAHPKAKRSLLEYLEDRIRSSTGRPPRVEKGAKGKTSETKENFDRPNRKEKKFGRGPEIESSGKDAQERQPSENDRGGVRKARVPQRGGKDPSGPVPGRKTQRKRRRR